MLGLPVLSLVDWLVILLCLAWDAVRDSYLRERSSLMKKKTRQSSFCYCSTAKSASFSQESLILVLSGAVHGQLALLLWPVVVSRWEGAQTGAKVLTPREAPKDKKQGAKIP